MWKNTVLNDELKRKEQQSLQNIDWNGTETGRDGGPEKADGWSERQANRMKTQIKVDGCGQPECGKTKKVVGGNRRRQWGRKKVPMQSRSVTGR